MNSSAGRAEGYSGLERSIQILALSAASALFAGVQAPEIEFTDDQKELVKEARDAFESLRAKDVEPAQSVAESPDAGKSGFNEARAALIALGESFPDPRGFESDGSIEVELIRMGQAWRDDQSATHSVFRRLSTSPKELIESEGIVVGPVSANPLKDFVRAAYSADQSELDALDPSQRDAARLTWQSALLMPSMIGVEPGSSDLGIPVAFGALIMIRDSRALPVLAERVRVDVERYDWPSRRALPIHSVPMIKSMCRLAVTDGEVSQFEMDSLVEVFGYYAAALDDPEQSQNLTQSLADELKGGWLTPIPLAEQRASPSRPSTMEEYRVYFQLWHEAFERHPREELSTEQIEFLDSMSDVRCRCGAARAVAELNWSSSGSCGSSGPSTPWHPPRAGGPGVCSAPRVCL